MPYKRPVVAVIPHYNMPQTLPTLVKQALDQNYNEIYVLDDNSTNCNPDDLINPFGTKVKLIQGSSNLGASGNRNRIINAGRNRLEGTILHFIDADCTLDSDKAPDLARKLFDDESIGEVGGLVLNSDGSIFNLNFFPNFSWRSQVSYVLNQIVLGVGRINPRAAKRLRRLFRPLVDDFPGILEKPVARDVFAVSEANMLIPYDTLVLAGGFDPTLRAHEAIDLAYKLKAKGLKRRFDPSIAVKHHAVQIAGKKRVRDLMRASLKIIRKHGLSLD